MGRRISFTDLFRDFEGLEARRITARSVEGLEVPSTFDSFEFLTLRVYLRGSFDAPSSPSPSFDSFE